MSSKKTSGKLIIVLVAFIVFFSYLKYFDIKGALLYAAVGIYSSVICYSLFADQTNRFLRIFISLLVIVGGFSIPKIFPKGEWAANDEQKISPPELFGNWVTDTTGGYSIKLSIHKDSAYLSQSNLDVLKGYELKVNDNFMELTNHATDQFYSWEYELLKNQQVLKLLRNTDSLVFERIKLLNSLLQKSDCRAYSGAILPLIKQILFI